MAAVTASGEGSTAGVKENEFWGGELTAAQDYITDGTKFTDLNDHTLIIVHVAIAADGDTYTNLALFGDRVDSVAFQGDDNAGPELAQAFISDRSAGVITFDTNTASAQEGWLWALVFNGDNMGRKI